MNIWATFVRKFVTKKFKTSPNLVTLNLHLLRLDLDIFILFSHRDRSIHT